MTNKPMEFKFKIYRAEHGFNIVYDHKTTIEMEIGEYHTIEAGPVLEKIKRLESALKWCKLQRNDYITDVISWPTGNVSARKNEISKCDTELESILEGR